MDELIMEGSGAPEIMTAEYIRSYSASVDNLNPIHYNVEAAREEGYEGLVAPASIPAVYGPIRLSLGSANWVTPGTLHVRQHMEFCGVICQNDYLYPYVKKVKSKDKKGRNIHKYICTFKNQRGEIVCVSTGTFLLPPSEQEGTR